MTEKDARRSGHSRLVYDKTKRTIVRLPADEAMTSDYQRGASKMREMAAKAASDLAGRLGNPQCHGAAKAERAIYALPLPADPASKGMDETGPPKIITPGNALWAFGLAEEEVKRLRAENAGLRAAMAPFAAIAETIPAGMADEWVLEGAWSEGVFHTITNGDFRRVLAALTNPTGVEGMDAPNHIMCIGWETIKRLAAGEAVWIDSIQAGAVAADDLLGVDINALLAPRSDPAGGERANAARALISEKIRGVNEPCAVAIAEAFRACDAEIAGADARFRVTKRALDARDAENAALRAALAGAKSVLEYAERTVSRFDAEGYVHSNYAETFRALRSDLRAELDRLAALASPDKLKPPALCNYEPYEPVGECKVDRCRRLGYCPWAGKQP